jgi:hypothetical protein
MVCVVALAAKVLTIFSRVGGAPDHTKVLLQQHWLSLDRYGRKLN